MLRNLNATNVNAKCPKRGLVADGGGQMMMGPVYPYAEADGRRVPLDRRRVALGDSAYRGRGERGGQQCSQS